MALFGCMIFARCANVGMPQGGPRDTLPPRIVGITPGNYSTNFKGKKIYIEFDEYVTLKNQQDEFYMAPFVSKRPSLMVKGRGIQVDIKEDSLLPNTTYSLNFGGSIVDNNEGNPFNSFRYVFSTGDVIDSMVMSGYTVDAYKADSLGKTFVMFFAEEKDSVPDYDSTLFKHKADFVARSENNGIFIAENLKPVNYRVYAMKDANGNQTYDPGVDKVAFLDGVYNPAEMEGFGVRYDTIRKYLVADPQLYFRLFTDKQFLRQNLNEAKRPLQKQILLDFNGEYPQIDSLVLEGIDSSQIIVEHLKPTQDSILLWLNVPAEQLPDTIKGRITYMKHDSLNELVSTTQELKLAWKFFESKAAEKERLQKERERQDMIKAGLEPPREPSPFKFKAEASQTLNPEKDIPMTFDLPLVEMDSSAITIELLANDTVAVPVRIRQDTANLRRWIIGTDWETGANYRFTIPEGALRNVADEVNDTIMSRFTVMDPEKYGRVVLNVKGKTPESTYILQLVDASGRMIDEIRGAVTGRYTFNYVNPAQVGVLVIEDLNGNGEWDSGNLVERRQPELAARMIFKGGENVLQVRANWELVEDADMSELFAPMTMQKMKSRLYEIDALNYKKWLEGQDDRRRNNRNNRNDQNGGTRQGSYSPTVPDFNTLR